MKRITGCWVFLLILTVDAFGAPNVPGFVVETISIDAPGGITFDPSTGDMYVGSPLGSARIRRVGPGGSPIVDFSNSAIPDPDAVLFDEAGVISGTPGSVLVGSQAPTNVSAVLPNGNVISVLGNFENINDMVFDSTGRLLMPDSDSPGIVYEVTGAGTNVLYTIPGDNGVRIEVDDNDRIYTAGSGETIRVHSSTGTLLDNSFATAVGPSAAMAFGSSGVFDGDLFTVGNDNLYRIDGMTGDLTTVGTGFGLFAADVEFGPDGALYVASQVDPAIYRISPIPEPSTFILTAIGLLGLLLFARLSLGVSRI